MGIISDMGMDPLKELEKMKERISYQQLVQEDRRSTATPSTAVQTVPSEFDYSHPRYEERMEDC